MKGIYWIASYPKSGNTWFRIFLTNLRHNGDTPADINRLDKTPIASARPLFDNWTGLASSNLTTAEIDELRPKVYEKAAENAKEPLFMKIHDAFSYLADGTPLVSTHATLGAVYIVRNPLDVAVSFAHHTNVEIDKIIANMEDKHYAFGYHPKRLSPQLRQKLLSWGLHCGSWLDAPEVKTHLLRYEDMHLNPIPTFYAAVRFVNLPYSKKQILKALRMSDFKLLKRQEEEGGFCEKSPGSEAFFRKGRIGSWREALTLNQVQRIICAHHRAMRRFGYLDQNNEVVF